MSKLRCTSTTVLLKNAFKVIGRDACRYEEGKEKWNDGKKEEEKKQTGRCYKVQNICVRKQKGLNKVQKQRGL